MNRRDTVLALAALGASPVFCNAQQRTMPVVGLLGSESPAVYRFREFAAAGGPISYGGSIADAFRETGVYTGRILKREKPANLPIQQVTKVDLYVNLRTAKVLGINVPNTPIARADEVIE
jgi:putative ABC transport system substrate-binding protein